MTKETTGKSLRTARYQSCPATRRRRCMHGSRLRSTSFIPRRSGSSAVREVLLPVLRLLFAAKQCVQRVASGLLLVKQCVDLIDDRSLDVKPTRAFVGALCSRNAFRDHSH